MRNSFAGGGGSARRRHLAPMRFGSRHRGRLAHDPWAVTDQLVTVSVESWKFLVGADKLPAVQAA